jgi:hypothetical protein
MNDTIETIHPADTIDALRPTRESDAMSHHPIDTVSALCGAAVLTIAALVALGRTGALSGDSVWWIALAALVFGLALLPWGRIRRREAGEESQDDDLDGDLSPG